VRERRRLILPLLLPVMVLSGDVPPPASSGAGAVPRVTRPIAADVAFPAAAPVPFGPGEEAIYKLKVGILNAGTARLGVANVEDVRGRSAYRLEMEMQGGVMGLKVDDTFRSWMDVSTLASRRFFKDIHEVRYNPPPRQFEIYPEERRWERTDGAEEGETLSSLPLDELAFIYFLRTMPRLEVGEEYPYQNYFKEDGNPVRVKVLRRERKTVPAGTFNTIVVQPIIRTSGLFAEGGRAEVYLTDDEHRHVVYLSTRIPKLGVGHITLHLTELTLGRPLNPR
jgi:hypothetical protein